MDLLKIETNKYSSDRFDIFFTTGIIPKITRPTRITHTSATLMDNIYIKHNCMNNVWNNYLHIDNNCTLNCYKKRIKQCLLAE